jgi:hypothetical protein
MPDSLYRITGALDELASRDLGIPRRRGGTSKITHAAQTGVDVERGRARVYAARVEGLGLVSRLAMQQTGRLAFDEGFLRQHTPWAAGRYALIADNAAVCMADIVSEMGRE